MLQILVILLLEQAGHSHLLDCKPHDIMETEKLTTYLLEQSRPQNFLKSLRPGYFREYSRCVV
jgi:hypothetical protein